MTVIVWINIQHGKRMPGFPNDKPVLISFAFDAKYTAFSLLNLYKFTSPWSP